MANRRVLVKRRKSVRNIRKITRTMQLIATARFQAAFNRAVATRPYTDKLAELVADLSGAAENLDHPLLKAPAPVGGVGGIRKSATFVLTSARGLCGGYNSNVLRTSLEHLDSLAAQGQENLVHMVGKKGVSYFRFIRRPMAEQIVDIGESPRFDQVEPLANELIARFLRGEISAAYVSYMRFLSAGQQKPAVIQILPLVPPKPAEEAGAKPKRKVDYEFSPEPQELLDELLPAVVRMRLFQAFIDAAISEQVARMVAMKAATDAAGDMIKALTREYNRARQTQITMELLDIVGGANALA
jgi:F-type H+-transporting ATPase subunit gamma